MLRETSARSASKLSYIWLVTTRTTQRKCQSKRRKIYRVRSHLRR
jgi:hypothetical protein